MRTILPCLLLLSTARPQSGCDGRGSEPQPARWEAGLPLRCAHAPEAIGYLLYTPAHRVLVPRPGFAPGEARLRTQWIVRFRCTGLRLLPVVVAEVRAYGVVLDVGQQRCAAGGRALAAPVAAAGR
jgi:hypothetical protein